MSFIANKIGILSIILIIAATGHLWAAALGDIDQNQTIDLQDAILGLRILDNIAVDSMTYSDADVNGDGKIGPDEIIFVLQKVAEIRPTSAWQIILRDPYGETIRPLLGVNIGPYPSGENKNLTAEYQQIGVTLVRTHDFYGPLDMVQMYPDRSKNPADSSSYNFVESDVRFRAIVDAKCEPYFRLGDSYNNSTPPTSAQLSNWVQASVQVLKHYRQGLWNGFINNFKYVEIWNEPDYDKFWPKPFTIQDYFKLYSETAKALKAAFPELKIGGAGWTPKAALTTDGQQMVRQFLDSVKAQNAPLDFISWHIYSDSPQEYADAASFYRSVLDEKGFTDAESHITEWNTSTADTDFRVNAKGAALNTAFWIELQNRNVNVATFYRGPDSSMSLPTFYGIYKADGSPKKTAYAFDLWSDMSQYPDKPDMQTRNSSNPPQLWILAGRKSDGKMAVLLSNPNDTATSYSVEYAGAGNLKMGSAAITVFEVSDNHEGIRQYNISSDYNTIGGRTVQLLTINP